MLARQAGVLGEANFGGAGPAYDEAVAPQGNNLGLSIRALDKDLPEWGGLGMGHN